MTPPSETLETTWATLVQTGHDPAVTVRPEDVTLSDHPAGSAGLAGDPLELGEPLGQGGMGVVLRGVQTRLGREVAVKALRPDVPRAAARKLLEEARVTGALEHPNIVPVYDVQADARGLPLVVLKRVDGTSWQALLDGEAALPADAGPDAVAWHLGVLGTVCRAIEFAHDRGVVHRDLKPENVMIGRFGEVWVLDWGIAVTVRDDLPGLPRARDQRHLVGTPNYLAPEMLSGGSGVTPATDVYLLGGILYRVLAGRPPHVGAGLEQVLANVGKMPPLGPSWPRDLRELLGAALAPDPLRRPTVRAFREAVASHVARRDASRLLDRALDGAARLSALLAAPDAQARRSEVYDQLGACRFGLREALARRPGDPDATRALRDALLATAAFELDAHEPRAAHLLLDEAGDPPIAMAARLAEVEREAERRAARAARLREDASLATGAGARIGLVAVFVVIWVALPIGLTAAGVPSGYPRALGVDAFQLAVTGLAAVATARSILRSQVNRAVLAVLVLVPSLSIALMLASWSWGWPIEQALTVELLLDATLILFGAATADWRMLPSAVVFLAAFGASAFAPEHVRSVTSVACVLLGLNALLAWGGAWRRRSLAV